MELRHLRYFVAVAEELHFRRAAEVVHIAQPALSRQIRELEQEIGAKLFERSQHKVHLTTAGNAFYSKARSILKDAKQAITDARAAEDGETGTLVIGFVSSAAIVILPEFLAKIRQQMPRAEVELRELPTGEQIDCLYRSSIDIGFFHARLEEPAFESLILSREKLVVALPNANKLIRGSKVNLKDLAEETLITPGRHSTPGYFELVRASFQAAGIQPKRIYHTHLLQTGLLLVGAGLGVSLVPESFMNIRVAGVVYRQPTPQPPPIDLLSAWRRDNRSPVFTRAITYLRAMRALPQSIVVKAIVTNSCGMV